MAFRIDLVRGELDGVDALDFCERMGLGATRQHITLYCRGKFVTVSDAFVRAYAPTGGLVAFVEPSWLLPGEVRWHKSIGNAVELADLPQQRVEELMVAFLHHEQEKELTRLRDAISEAIRRISASKNSFKSAAMAEVRELLEQALNPGQES